MLNRSIVASGGWKLNCGVQVMLSFLADPSAAPDTSCLEDIAPIDFGANSTLASQILGKTDIWEN